MLHWDLKFRNNFRLFITMQRCLQDPRNHINKMESFATIVNGLDVWGGGGGHDYDSAMTCSSLQKQPPQVLLAFNLIWKESLTQVLSCEFCEIYKNTFLQITSGRLLLSQRIYQCSNETSLMWMNCSLNLSFFQTQLKNNSFFNKK